MRLCFNARQRDVSACHGGHNMKGQSGPGSNRRPSVLCNKHLVSLPCVTCALWLKWKWGTHSARLPAQPCHVPGLVASCRHRSILVHDGPGESRCVIAACLVSGDTAMHRSIAEVSARAANVCEDVQPCPRTEQNGAVSAPSFLQQSPSEQTEPLLSSCAPCSL